MEKFPCELVIEKDNTATPPGQAWASVLLNGVPVFTQLVYDNKTTPGERNILLMFGDRLRRLLEEGD